MKKYVCFAFGLLALSGSTAMVSSAQSDIEHVKVYYEEGRFAGWPANNGIWMWGDEILVGFVEAKYEDDGGFHTYDRSTARHTYARSRDGGSSWTTEDAYERGQTARAFDHELDGEETESPSQLTEAIDFTHPDLALTFVRQTNNTGPSHFYYSYDRGTQWEGPYMLPDFETNGVATRPDYIIDGEQKLMAFLTVAKSNDREGRVMNVQTTDGGKSWEKISWIGPEPEGFEIMPASLRLSSSKILTVIRHRTGEGKDLMTSYVSEDNGKNWERLDDPVSNTGRGGSPPALIELEDGRLVLSYTVRSNNGSRVCIKFSDDEGETWSDEFVLRADGATADAGYPRMIRRRDGKLVVIYYWNNAMLDELPPYRYIAATIFDPDDLNQ